MYIPPRHGCLTAWLYFILVGGTLGLGVLMLTSQLVHRPDYRPPPPSVFWSTVGCALASMVCAGGLFLLKRWAFWGYVLFNVTLSGINVAAGNDATYSLAPILWVLCLAGVMGIGKRRYRAWGRLR